uniref:Glycosyltransferase n=1 Tax=Gongylonema pulchrum TaxID=637853 RepID=A0A183EE92_9BILA
LLSDYEFMFSHGFEKYMYELAEKYLTANPKAVLVCRIFEALGTMSTVPRDKDSLHKRYINGTAVQFHALYAGDAHEIAGLDEWFAHNSTTAGPQIDHTIPYIKYSWEPQFVSLTTIPFHDENFPYLVRDNTVLRWEMCRMNYTFLLVHDHFMVHPGIKTKGVPRKHAIEQYNFAASEFRERMDRLYPETKSLCPAPRP